MSSLIVLAFIISLHFSVGVLHSGYMPDPVSRPDPATCGQALSLLSFSPWTTGLAFLVDRLRALAGDVPSFVAGRF
jgi:hypothetical protein